MRHILSSLSGLLLLAALTGSTAALAQPMAGPKAYIGLFKDDAVGG